MFWVLVEHVWVVAQAESVSGVPDAPLGLLPVARHAGPLLVDGLLDDRLLIIPAIFYVNTCKVSRKVKESGIISEWLVLVLPLYFDFSFVSQLVSISILLKTARLLLFLCENNCPHVKLSPLSTNVMQCIIFWLVTCWSWSQWWGWAGWCTAPRRWRTATRWTYRRQSAAPRHRNL